MGMSGRDEGAMPAAQAADSGARIGGRRFISMRLIVTAVSVGLTAAAVLGVGVVSERHSRRALSREIEARLRLQAYNLALTSSGALLSEFPELTLAPLVKEMQGEGSELSLVVVVDHQDLIQGHADARQLGQPFSAPAGLAPLPGGGADGAGVQLLGNHELLVAAAPVLHPGGRVIGRAMIGLPRNYADALMAAARREQLILVSGVLGAGVLLALLLMGQLLKPVAALRAGLERIGRGDLDTPLAIAGRTELGLLAEAVNHMARDLKAAQGEMVEKERLAHEMALARDIQRNLLPAAPIACGDYRIVGGHRAAAEVGGDYFDVIALPEGRYGIAIADVSGKGLVGCMIMAMLSALLRSHLQQYDSPAALLVALEQQLASALKPGQFITMFYGVLDPARHRLTYASAAHSPLLVQRAAGGQSQWLRTGGIPLGAVRGGALARTLEDFRIDLAPGDLLVQYTDGINEAFSPAGEQFGFDRLAETVRACAPRGAGAVLAGLREAVLAWTGGGAPFDDETLLVVGREGSGAAAGAASSAAVRGAAPAAGDAGRRAGALALLDRARAGAAHLALPADMAALDGIRAWLRDCPGLADLASRDGQLVESALYEACANIVEHGYSGGAGSLDLWWLPADAAEPAAAGRRPRGVFLIHDEGRPFDLSGWKASNFHDLATRRRGRGLGLDIIQRVMDRVSTNPGGAEGNLTVLELDLDSERTAKETCDV